MLQARRLGNELLVGIHSDEEILENKGPTVMTLEERSVTLRGSSCSLHTNVHARVAAVDACRWSTLSIPHAPYVTSLPWISHYGCQYVVHGDDITSDSNGEDCYRFVKAAGRFLVVKRTPGISTTDLVGRMLLCTKTHFIKSLTDVLEGREGSRTEEERIATGSSMLQRIRDYATDESGHKPGPEVWTWLGSSSAKVNGGKLESGDFASMVPGIGPTPGQRIVYVDGGFDLFSSGHIEFLRQVYEKEHASAYVVAGVHDDNVINHWKGLNYPIMNVFERGLCVLQCKYVSAVVFSAPFSPNKAFLRNIPFGNVSAVYHGPTAFMPLTYDPYVDAKEMGIFKTVQSHAFEQVNAGEIVERILKSREAFAARQRKKGEKAIGEEAVWRREVMDREAAETAKIREQERS
jgi:ethanolamine-phosphate cytidylyltransferase